MVRKAKARDGPIEAAVGAGFLVATLGGVGQLPDAPVPGGQSGHETRAI
jgi:hypothetical protein